MIVVSIINHSYWSYVQQLSPHKSAINPIESPFLLAKSPFSGLGRGFTRWAPWGTSYEDLGPSSPPSIEAILAPECDDVQKSHVRWCTEYIYIYIYIHILYHIMLYHICTYIISYTYMMYTYTHHIHIISLFQEPMAILMTRLLANVERLFRPETGSSAI